MPSPLDTPHHDGSELYVPEPPADLGDEITVLLRVAREAPVEDVAVRYVRDQDPLVVAAEVDRETESHTWWRASFPVWNPATPYRWLLSGGSFGYAWLNGAGLQPFDVPDADDFVATPEAGGPDWHLSSVVYEVFPDRFASAGLDVAAPEWAIPRSWDELPTGRGPETPFEWYGGDLVGLEQRLDHISELGANVLYLTPIFPAGSTHRYDARTFDEVDPLLGGDDALVALTRAAGGRGLRVLGDLTTNHVGSGHGWFAAALAGSELEREFFYFDPELPSGYECWYGHPSLPKLNYASSELRRRMYEGERSAVRRWLEPPFALDGWRIDVA
ncbi:MAG TPA: alpha-amylase family glycosyl hydrolase, partial [Actinomycetota bacterium]|nr:alpha-amylase family glycosyl hydrolase [Actinomycetota bacterium]